MTGPFRPGAEPQLRIARKDGESNMNANKPIIVVTGGNRGIGFEICRQLAGRGAQVVLTARSPETGEDAVKKLGAQNLAAQFHPLNVTAQESIAALRGFLERTFGRLDALINNAGILPAEKAPGLAVDLAAAPAFAINKGAPACSFPESAAPARGCSSPGLGGNGPGRPARGR
jgi:NAD(P)-dependent dehydrogenase (short-subunit alcohol dehydrogenase family)